MPLPTFVTRSVLIAASLALVACGGASPAVEDGADVAAVSQASPVGAADEPAGTAATGRCTTTAEWPPRFPDDLPLPEGFGFHGGSGGSRGYWELTGCLLESEATASLRGLVDDLQDQGWRVGSERLEPLDKDAVVELVHDSNRYYEVQVVGEPFNGVVRVLISLALSTD